MEKIRISSTERFSWVEKIRFLEKTGLGGNNLGIYEILEQDKILKVISRDSYPSEKKAFTLVREKKLEEYIITPSEAVLFEDNAVLVMKKASGSHLFTIKEMREISQEGWENLAKIFVKISLSGIAFNDPSLGNIFFDEKTKAWTLIDTACVSPSSSPAHSLKILFDFIELPISKTVMDCGDLFTFFFSGKKQDCSDYYKKYYEDFEVEGDPKENLRKEIQEKFQDIESILKIRNSLKEKICNALPQEISDEFVSSYRDHYSTIFSGYKKEEVEERDHFLSLSWEKRVDYLLENAVEEKSLFQPEANIGFAGHLIKIFLFEGMF